jgi:3'(2'),5'-bisphosphate nucleotidase
MTMAIADLDEPSADAARSGRSAIVAALVEAVVAAGREILAVAAGGFEVAVKADRSPVTIADERAERVVLAALAALLPEVPVVAEEQMAAGRCPERLGHRFFLVDPLDGTREFVAGRDEYTVNIGLIEDGRPRLGVVLVPATGEIFTGIVGEGARAGRLRPTGDVVWRAIRAGAAPAGGFRALVSHSHAGAETEALLARLPIVERVAAGSSLKFCRLAEGVADLYPRPGRTMEWDTAAGEAVLVAAGGAVVDFDGRPLVYGGKASGRDFANPSFLAVGDPGSIGRVLAARG